MLYTLYTINYIIRIIVRKKIKKAKKKKTFILTVFVFNYLFISVNKTICTF